MPSEAAILKTRVIPSVVFAAVNDLIVARLVGGRASVKQKDIVAEITKRAPEMTERKLLDNHWLDIEDAYRHAGWNVEYDKPGYNESYDAHFVFQQQR